MDSSDLRTRARKRYELGRLRAALPWALPAGLFTAIAVPFEAGASPIGAVLAVLLVTYAWRGGTLARALVPGLGAGSFAFAMPLMLACTPGGCPAELTIAALLVPSAGGLLSGGILWRQVGPGSAAPALVIAATCAGMGCLALGAYGVVGVIAVLIAGAPTLVRGGAHVR